MIDKKKNGGLEDDNQDLIQPSGDQTLNSNNVPTYGVKLEKAFPIDSSVIALNNTDGEYLRCTITFAYDKYVIEGPLSSTASALKAAIPNGLI